MRAPQEITQILGILRSRPLIRNLVASVAIIHINHIALFGQLDAVLVWKAVEPPKNNARAIRTPMMEAIRPPFLAEVLNIQVSRTTQRLNRLREDVFSLPRILLVNGHWGRRRGRGALSQSH